MGDVGIRHVIRRNLLAVFAVALVLGSVSFHLLLKQAATRDAEQQARVLLSSSLGVRQYTTEQILPQLAVLTDHATVFHEQMVPSYAAQAVFRAVTRGNSAYSYSERALNPTARSDMATPFDVDLIQRFRANTALAELTGIRDNGGDRLFYLARPIRITDPACLTCHDVPSRAPPAMLAKYGAANGFGWKLNEVVGIQLLSVPVTWQFRATLRLVALLAAGLTLVFVVAYFALLAALDSAVIRPLVSLADAAEAASVGGTDTTPLPDEGAGELRTLAAAIQRLRVSLAKALQSGDRHGGA